MEAFSNYLLTLPQTRDRIFISNPPGPALLLWTNIDSLPNISGITIVEQKGNNVQAAIRSVELQQILQKQLSGKVPVLHIVYAADLSEMIIDDVAYELADAAKIMSKKLNIITGRNPAKKPNDPKMISDPFHLWSRDAFDGTSVIKTDVDFLLTKDGKVSSIWEVKRSKNVPVGRWTPYINPGRSNDINNYYLSISLSNLLNANFYTVHHEEMDTKAILSGDDLIDLFVYKPADNPQTLQEFARRRESTTGTIKRFFKI